MNTNEFSSILIDWYQQNKRDLPWRQTRDPYFIWISEIILQQTRVAQGYAYYQRFISRFPDLYSLAEADEDEVMKYWQGLGYYSRARNLHAAAKSMAQQGGFPTSYQDILALKGVGAYTAAAISSFAYNLPYAVVDGNVYRVLSRWMGIDLPIDSSKGQKYFAALAQELIDKNHPAVYNQAIMDFGALQCTPASPDCPSCPLADQCIAYATHQVASFPVKSHKTKVTNRYFNYIYVRMGDMVCLRKRTGNDIWKNLYEIPLIETEQALNETAFYALPALKSQLAEGEKPVFTLLQQGVKHVLSHQVILTNFYLLELPHGSSSFPDYQRVKEDNLHKFAVSRLLNQFFSLHLNPKHK